MPDAATQTDLILVKPGAVLTPRDTPIPLEPPARSMTALEAYEAVLATIGATQPTALAGDAWPNLHGTDPQPDRDGDGLPDIWEQMHGLNPDDPADAARVAGPKGWTHLELWLNGK